MAADRAPRDPRRRHACRRSRHRHRQDLRLSRARAAERRQAADLHWHKAAAGPALSQGPARGAQGTQAQCGDGAAQGPRQLSVPASHGARRGRSAASVARGCASPAIHRPLCRDDRRPATAQSSATCPRRAAIWPLVTSTRDNCLGAECPRFAECFVFKARREAQAADVVVVNHHLFLADLATARRLDPGLPACRSTR